MLVSIQLIPKANLSLTLAVSPNSTLTLALSLIPILIVTLTLASSNKLTWGLVDCHGATLYAKCCYVADVQ